MAMLFITHDLGIVRKMADRICVMTEGEIVEHGADRRDLRRPAAQPTPGTCSPPSPRATPPVADPTRAAGGRSEGPQGLVPDQARASSAAPSATSRRWTASTSRVREGETLGIVGESGSGKTTLGRALLRLISSKGRIVYRRPADRRASAGRRCGRSARDMQIVFQDPYRLAEPAHVGRRDRRRRPRASTSRDLTAEERDARVVARPHRSRARSRRTLPLPARILGRPAPAHRHRPRHGARAEVRRPRRADLGARHERPGPGRRSPPRAAAAAQRSRYLFISHDLKVVRALANEIVDHAGGQGGRAGAGRRGLRRPRSTPTPSALLAAAFDIEALPDAA